MANDLVKIAKDKGIKYFLISYVDLFGVLRAKLSPAAAIQQMMDDGAGFAGFATWLDMTPAHADLFAKPDPDSLIQLPCYRWHRDIVDRLFAEMEEVAQHLALDLRQVADDIAAAPLLPLFLGLVEDLFDLFAKRRFLVAAE